MDGHHQLVTTIATIPLENLNKTIDCYLLPSAVVRISNKSILRLAPPKKGGHAKPKKSMYFLAPKRFPPKHDYTLRMLITQGTLPCASLIHWTVQHTLGVLTRTLSFLR